ncbi:MULTISPECIES: ead/Ea22-like family protein [Burkholderia]|uniref:ead/Ea22-like family protein n=1 Tax=Burkholderia TaxID=32008 RepID=UPI0015C606A7|nr:MULTISPECIES: ead/Ea22-like family protein [Burkholderia]MBY4723891.1 hypothetical protein [Burkholderia contaminans]MCI3973200.1 hypothetical protein [Burkholderia sp. HI4860]MDN7791560.1 hypothetical protein [Burkholderia contaminans]
MQQQPDQAPTPAAKWRAAGESDPHGSQYDCERSKLTLGRLTDDELANAVFLHDHRSLNVEAILRGEPSSIALLTAAKERIRWLSRALEATGTTSQAARDVLAERRRQVDVEGFTPAHDDEYLDGELAVAGGSYALHAFDRRIALTPAWWPWQRAWWKPAPPRQMLVKAGALILAAIEQIDRRAAK